MNNYYIKNRTKILLAKKLYNKSARCKKLRKIWWLKNKTRYDKQKVYYMAKHYYGISKEDYTKALNAQNNRCAICQFKRKLCVDHNHKTGNIRGFLCKHCNSSISLFENKVLFEKTLKYLGVKR